MSSLNFLNLNPGGVGPQLLNKDLDLSSHQNFKDPYTHGTDKYEVRGSVPWDRSLGEELCIFDVDTRRMTGKGQAWSEDTLDWIGSEYTASGHLNHFLYAMIHGYKYRFIHVPSNPDRDPVWARVPTALSLLQECRIVVYVDNDVIFPHLGLPMEWLLNYWNITADIAVAMTLEPLDWRDKVGDLGPYITGLLHTPEMAAWVSGHDTRGRRAVNGGFTIVQNTTKARDLLRRWQDCPTGRDYPGCERFAKGWPAEQGAFNEHVRHDFLDHIREIPCDEAMGYAEGPLECHGKLVRHHTVTKEWLKRSAEDALGGFVMSKVHEAMLRGKKDIYEDRSS